MNALKQQNLSEVENYLNEIDRTIPKDKLPEKDKAFMTKARAHVESQKADKRVLLSWAKQRAW